MSADDKLSADSSPGTMELKKKKARRINNWPLFIALIVVVVLSSVIGWVMLDRNNKAAVEDPGSRRANGGSAISIAKDLIERKPRMTPPPLAPPVPEPAPVPMVETQSTPAIPPPVVLKASAPVPIQAKAPPKPSEEVIRLRQRKLRAAELAIDSPIKVNFDANKVVMTKSDQLAGLDARLAMAGDREAADKAYQQQIAMSRAMGGGGGGGEARSQSSDILERLSSKEGQWDSVARVEAPSTRYILRAGSLIPARLISGINSDLRGEVIGEVTEDVYDTPVGNYRLIPKFSMLYGRYESDVHYGQSRIFVAWQRVTFPDGKVMDLGAMPSATGMGFSGMRDRVNHRFFRLFGSALLMSGVIAGVEMSQDEGSNNTSTDQKRMGDAMSEALGQTFGSLLTEMFRKNLEISPTIEIRPGYRFKIIVTKDLIFNGAYKAFDYTTN